MVTNPTDQVASREAMDYSEVLLQISAVHIYLIIMIIKATDRYYRVI